MVFNPDNFDFFGGDTEEGQANPLLKYLQHQSPEVLARVAKSVSPEIRQIISQNVQGLVGVLPSEAFNVQITTDRENLAGLLASAMMTGYFLSRMEQRMELEASIRGTVAFGIDLGEEAKSPERSSEHASD
ncbi:MAG: DUF760 domain-containing protein [Pegethrix bostrychoides GSE-TBD4-15B]|jgi:hypothetical protein|uniref:DUF760 domain-containing protein n=1 Tax=Pegethrix bostrychoides GSE-TBD4-15B TaxID=2839662 RepID=A0A951PEY2_9CYAN|nr:DUF760 domain-containing protein [Pegethrix bostrychoides GSE-TBD4-15B]